MRTLLTLAVLFVLQSLQAQCDFTRLLEEGRSRYRQGEYRQALHKFNAARICDRSQSALIDREVEKVFIAIEKQRESEAAGRKLAEEEEQKARAQQTLALQARLRADSLSALQQKAVEELAAETAHAALNEQKTKDLAQRGERLLADVAQTDDDTFGALMSQARAYLNATRYTEHDYSKAQVYLSLARFVRSDPTLDTLLGCIRLGEKADAFFAEGALNEAQSGYNAVGKKLNSVGFEAVYETLQSQHIDQMRQQMEAHRAFNDYAGGTRLTLKGDWWVVPREMLASPQLKSVIFIENKVLEQSLPIRLGLYPNIDTLCITGCSNFTGLGPDQSLSQLTSLQFRQNTVLKELDFQSPLPELTELIVVENPVLIRLKGLDNLPALKTLLLVDNPLLKDFLPSLSHPLLENLRLQGSKSIHALGTEHTHWPQLRSLQISQVKNLKTLAGYTLYPQLKRLTLEKLPAFDSLSGFEALPTLHLLIIDSTGIKTLAGLKNLPQLDSALITRNAALIQLPLVSAIAKPRFIQLTRNINLNSDVGTANALFLSRVEKMRSKSNAKKYQPFLNIYASRLRDHDSYDFYKGKKRNKAFSDLLLVGLSLTGDPIDSRKVDAFLGFALQYLSLKGETAARDDYWDAIRQSTNASGDVFESVRTISGNEWLNFSMIDLQIRFGGAVPLAKNLQAQVGLGFGVVCRLPGTIGLRIGQDYEYQNDVRAKVKGSATGFLSLAYYLGRFKFFGELGLWTPLIGDKKIENEVYTFKQQFYSPDVVSFSTEPLQNAYRISYRQETLPSFGIRGVIGVGYRLSKF